MKISKDLFEKSLSFVSDNQTHYLYGFRKNQQTTIVFQLTKEPISFLPYGLSHVQTLTKQNAGLQSKKMEVIAPRQANRQLINCFFIAFRLPYLLDQYDVRGFIWQDSVYSCDSQDLSQLVKQITTYHCQFLKQNMERLTSQKCTVLLTPLTYVLQGLYTPKSIDKMAVQQKTYQLQHTKVLPSMLIWPQLEKTNDYKKQAGILINDRIHDIIHGDLKYHYSLAQQAKIHKTLRPNKIFNPHMMCKTPEKDKFLQYYTRGIYEYFHYGDQKFNDIGWGCMYRALQTLLSWLHLQNYYTFEKQQKQVPNILELQSIIDSIDRSRKIKGSNQWIGATQAAWVINKLTNIDCRIIHVQDGKQILQHCQTFRQHFQKVGSPIPYGGGEYAYSIVGMNYNWRLGQSQFLILDPHYPGTDEYSSIVQKKGVTWRKVSQMFKKGIFYNFCVPVIK